MNGATDKPLFSRRLLLGFLGFAICSFALSLYLMGRSDHGADRYGPSSYSISALGYAGIGEVLQELGIPVAKSRRNPHIQAKNGVLIVAEPQLNRLPQSVVPVLPDAEKVLLVLPKWRALDRGERRGWIEKAERILSQQIEGILRLVADKAYVERRSSVEQWTTNTIGVAPELVRQVQLIKSGLLKPIVAAGDGILVGELREDDRLIWVLSDPDVIANHALSPEGKGFSFAIALINTIRGSGPVVFDETVHGFQLDASQSAFRLLFEFPYVIITVQMVIGVALLLWATMGRFGPPDVVEAPLAVGKAGLIGNVADLMQFAGHERLIIRNYVENTIRETARQLRAPKNLSYQQTLQWLTHFAQRRGINHDCTAIAQFAQELTASSGHVDSAKFADVARQIYQWKQEMLDGPSIHSRHH
jgi:hypothetical protein